MDSLIARLGETEKRFRELEAKMSDPSAVSDAAAYASLLKEYKSLAPLMEAVGAYKSAVAQMGEAQDLLSCGDSEMEALAKDEYKESKDRADSILQSIRVMLIPKDPNDEKNVLVEIRAGTGGEEAALFAADLFRMYGMYASASGFSVTVESSNPTELGGYKEIVFSVTGTGAYSRFKFEAGVHRVQRVPVTGAADKLQTSAATVAVLPEADEISVEIDPGDLILESCKSSGAGGQHINKTESAVRITHKPSGIVVECQEERSQLQNRNKAMQMLRTKLLAQKQKEADDKLTADRRSMVGSGDRSAKIRTYNFPQNRVTDHRINLTLYSLDSFLSGNIGEMVDALIAADTAQKLNQGEKL